MTSPHCAHQANALTLDIELREARAEVRRLEAALATARAGQQLASDNAEELADALHQESQAHARTRQLMADAAREQERLLSVAVAAHLVLGVTDNPTTLEQQSERLQELGVALTNLRDALSLMRGPSGSCPHATTSLGGVMRTDAVALWGADDPRGLVPTRERAQNGGEA